MTKNVDVLCIGHIYKGRIVAEQDLGLLDELKAAGAEILPILTEETTGIENIIPNRNSDQRTCYLLGFAGTFTVENLPPVDARVYHVGTIVPGEVDLPLLEEIASRGQLAVDAQGSCAKK